MKTKRSLSTPTYWLSVVALGLLVGFSIQFAKAWVDPAAAPPGGIISGPVTTGNTNQVKSAGLGLTGNMVVGGALQVSSLNAAGCDLKTNAAGTFYCGVDATGVGGDNLGNHTATTALNMAGQNIYNLAPGKAIAWGGAPGAGDVIYSDGSNMALATAGDLFVLDRAWNTNNVIANDYWVGAAGRWASATAPLHQNSCYWETATWNGDCVNQCAAGYYVAGVRTYKGEFGNTGCGEGSLVAIPYCCLP